MSLIHAVLRRVTRIEKGLLLLLQKAYLEEFEVIDGLNQHPDGLPFDEWLERHLGEYAPSPSR